MKVELHNQAWVLLTVSLTSPPPSPPQARVVSIALILLAPMSERSTEQVAPLRLCFSLF